VSRSRHGVLPSAAVCEQMGRKFARGVTKPVCARERSGFVYVTGAAASRASDSGICTNAEPLIHGAPKGVSAEAARAPEGSESTRCTHTIGVPRDQQREGTVRRAFTGESMHGSCP